MEATRNRRSDLSPLLVDIYDTQTIYELSYRKDPEARNHLATAISDLLNKNVSNTESDLISDILISLIRQAEVDLRSALSEKLAVMKNAPLQVVLELANDEIDVAKPMLVSSEVLGDLDLLYIIQSKDKDYWRSIAQRRFMNEVVIDALADTYDVDTALNLAENKEIVLTQHAVCVLSDVAQNEERVAQPLLRRDEISPDFAAKLYHSVGQVLKDTIKNRFPDIQQYLDKTLDEIVLEFTQDNPIYYFSPVATQMQEARQLRGMGLLNEKLMVAALKKRQYQRFVALFSVYCGMSVEKIIPILKQHSGMGLAVLCRARGFKKQDFLSLYLLSHEMRGSDKPMKKSQITDVIEYFESIKPHTAAIIMENSILGR